MGSQTAVVVGLVVAIGLMVLANWLSRRKNRSSASSVYSLLFAATVLLLFMAKQPHRQITNH